MSSQRLTAWVERIKHSRLRRTAGVYTLANIMDAIVPFTLLPVLTRYLDPVEYGIVAMYQVLVGLVGPFVGLSVHGAVLRRFYDRDRSDLDEYVGNCVLVLAASTTAVGLLLVAFGNPVSRLAAFPREWLWAVLASSIGVFVGYIRLAIWQAQGRAKRYGGFQVSRTLVNFAMSIGLVVGLGLGWEGRVLGQVAAHGATGLAALALLRRDGFLTFNPRLDHAINALRFGVPLIPHALAGYLITAADRFFLTQMSGLALTGLYLVGVQLAKGLTLVFQAVNQAYTPWLFGRLRDGDSGHRLPLVRATYGFFGLALTAAAAVWLVADPVVALLAGPDFRAAAPFVGWLALGAAFNGMYMILSGYIFYEERTGLLAFSTGAAGVLNLILNYVLISRYGAIGAAYATAASFFAKFVLTWWLAHRVHPMPWLEGLRPWRSSADSTQPRP